MNLTMKMAKTCRIISEEEVDNEYIVDQDNYFEVDLNTQVYESPSRTQKSNTELFPSNLYNEPIISGLKEKTVDKQFFELFITEQMADTMLEYT